MTLGTKVQKLIVSPSPHIHCGSSITKTMYTFIVALIPAVIFAINSYGLHAARVISLAIAGAMIAEFVIQKIMKRDSSFYDGSALLTGLLLALIIPPSVPWWFVLMGSFISIIIGKQIFGGIGYAPLNPVLVGWAILRISWGDYLNFDIAIINYDLAFSYEYPLSILKKVGASGISGLDIMDLIFGKQSGGLGASAIIWIFLGGVFLLLRGVISSMIPVAFILGVAITSALFWGADSVKYASPLFHIVTGNVMIGAFFLATHYSSSPVNKIPQLLFGFGAGALTIIFRVWGVYPDGVVFALMIMSLLNPILDKITPKIPGLAK